MKNIIKVVKGPLIIGVTGILLFSEVRANQLLSNSDISEIKKEQQKKWKGFVIGTLGTVLDTPNEEFNPMGSSLDAYFFHALPYNMELKVYAGMTKDLRREREEQISDAYVSLRRPLWFKDRWMLSGDVRIYFPFNKIHRDNQSFRTRAYASSSLSYRFRGVRGLMASWRLSLSRNFYQYNTSIQRTVNTGTSLSNLFQVVYSGIPRFTLVGYFVNSSGWSMLGNRKPDTFQIGQEVGYTFNKKLSVAVGHVNNGMTYYYDGTDFDVDIFDRYDSRIYASLTYGF